MARYPSWLKTDVDNDRWAAIGAIATVVGVVLAVLQLFAARPSSTLLAVLVVILALATFLFIVLALVRKRQPVVVFMKITNEKEQERYYRRFSNCLSSARSVIYYSGRGFSGRTKESEQYCLRTAEAVRQAVDAGAEYFRIQTGRNVSATWGDVYADLVEKNQGKVEVHEDTDDPTFVNIFITDPNDERTCVVQLLFEAERLSGNRPYHQTMGALFLYRNLPIAQGLQRIFVDRIDVLPTISPQRLRALGRTVLYFAHGSRDDHSRMLADAPAREVMAATLTGWKVESNVLLLPDRAKIIAGQDRPDDYKVDGLLYEISLNDKDQLDQLRAEEGHTPRWVAVKTWSGRQTCFIYVRGPANGLVSP